MRVLNSYRYSKFLLHKNLLIIVMVFFLYSLVVKQIDLITISFLINGVLAIALFFNSFKIQKISMAIMHYFFIFLFFVYVPLNQYLDDRFMNYNLDIYTYTLLYVNILITCWLVSFSIVYRFFQKTKYKIKIIKYKKKRLHLLYILYIPAFIIIVWTIVSGNIDSLLFRGASGPSVFNFDNNIISLIYSRSYQPLFLISFFYFYILRNYDNVPKMHLFFYFFIALGYNFPTSDARFYIFAIFTLFYIQFVMTKEKRSIVLFYYLILGILSSSFFELFRYLSRSITDYSFKFDYFYEGHFDSYENFLHTFNYVQDFSISYGYSLLSSIFFFVPREIWSSKAVGSGYFLAENYIDGARNLNIANSCISEYFFNFHIPGILVFGILYGLVSSLLDKSAKEFIDGSKRSIEGNLFLVVYAMLVGLFLFHLRGDMMSSLAYTAGILIAILFLNYSFGYRYTLDKE